MTTIDANEPEALSIDGSDTEDVTIDGSQSWEALGYVDDYARGNMNPYWFYDTNQSILPYTMNAAGYGDDAGFAHPSGNPNTAISLAPDNPGYNSSNQNTVNGTYFGPGDCIEYFFRPQTLGQIRFLFNVTGYAEFPEAIMIRMIDTGYWRLENYPHSDYYGGVEGGAPEDTFSWNTGSAHRVVVDMIDFPTASVHLWDWEGSGHISSLEGTDSNAPGVRGFAFWGNDQQQTHYGPIRHIDRSDYTGDL